MRTTGLGRIRQVPAEHAGVGGSFRTLARLARDRLEGRAAATHLTRDFTAPIPIPDPQWGTDNT